MSRRDLLYSLPPGAIAVALLSAAVAAPSVEPSVETTPAVVAPEPVRHSVRAPFFPEAPKPDEAVLRDEDLEGSLREPFRLARDQLVAGQPSRALALLHKVSPESAPERYVHASALEAAKRWREAGNAWFSLAGDYEPLRDRCHFRAGTALEETGDFARAAEALRAVPATSLLYKEAQQRLGTVLERLGDTAGAIAAIETLSADAAPPWGKDTAGKALLSLAELRARSGDREAAGRDFLRVWSEHPGVPGSRGALARARALRSFPSSAQRVRRGELLMEMHHSHEAVEILRPLVEAPPADLSEASLCTARFALGKALRKLRRHEEALAVFGTALENCGEDHETWARASYVAGTSASLVDREQGIRTYLELADSLPDHPYADDALFFAADLLMREGRTSQARRTLLKLAKLYPEGDYRAEGLFQIFWLDRREGRHERGLPMLERLVRDYAETVESPAAERAAYWWARTLTELGRVEEGVEAYHALARSHPGSFYGALARAQLATSAPERLKALLEERPSRLLADAASELPLRWGGLAGDPHALAALELLRMGFGSDASSELLAVDRARLKAEVVPHGYRLLVALLARAGEGRLAHVIARIHLREELMGVPTPENQGTWRIAFPRGYRELVELHAAEAGLDPDLLQALIREESALDPRARSWAGAVGLCQLMLPTAREVAGWLRVPGPVTAERLYDPDLNVRLGAHYLARMIKRFDGNWMLAVASYNAGAGAVGRWHKASGLTEIDAFVEEIPVEETRRYVKRVLGTYATYQLLYGGGTDDRLLASTLLAGE